MTKLFKLVTTSRGCEIYSPLIVV